MDKALDTSIRYLKGIGPKRARVFNAAGISSIEDLFYYFPRRYEDRTKIVHIKDLKEGLVQTVKVKVLARGKRQSWRRRFSIVELEAEDDTGRISCVWFNQPYLNEYFKVGLSLMLYGRVERYAGKLQMTSPEFELACEDSAASLDSGRIVPVYSLPAGLGQRAFRRFIKNILDGYLLKINDCLPFDIRSKNNLLNLAKALIEIHFPGSFDLQAQAFRRLCFEEFFLFQTLLVLRKTKKQQKQGIAHKTGGSLPQDYINRLPFRLTASQQTVIREIFSDMSKPRPMQRLLQGDVGSGKTVVAVATALAAIEGGYQAAFMAPTEVLAKQHYEKIKSQSHKVTKSQSEEIKICLLAGSTNKKEKEAVYRQIEKGEADIVIGTHALLEKNVRFKNLGLVVIDEQHKFGVGQRALLPQKGPNPDVLIMTATPIPRTLAITVYGDLDVSVINELPPGRVPVKTMHFDFSRQSGAYEVAKQQLALGHQVFIVYPVIEESYALDIAGAKKMYERLKAGEFKDFNIGLIHGRLKQDEQGALMSAFEKKEFNVMISTTVLEVGIDIPQATCMIIEHAERFGLSQLHQLRGRVGRSSYESFCILVSDAATEDAQARIAAMLKYSDGFHIAEEDLKIRGPGEFFGRRQHGLAELKIGNPLLQMQLLKKARDEAISLIDKDPHLLLRPNALLKQKLLQRFPEYEDLIIVG